MLKKKIPLSCTSSGHYYIPITKPLPDKCKFKYIPFIKKISSKNMSKKLKLQQSYIDNLVILVVRNCVTHYFALSTFSGLFGICLSFILCPFLMAVLFQLHQNADDQTNCHVYMLYYSPTAQNTFYPHQSTVVKSVQLTLFCRKRTFVSLSSTSLPAVHFRFSYFLSWTTVAHAFRFLNAHLLLV